MILEKYKYIYTLRTSHVFNTFIPVLMYFEGEEDDWCYAEDEQGFPEYITSESILCLGLYEFGPRAHTGLQ